ncbi:hypothetical protein EDF18_0971 [Frigoribacterium sp. PhB107]|uniref:hypothetical protein n=1 Tax=Frigoribacterium sp. PhB107 TaxID=2485172 RepID=UPI000F48D7B4|nr:hypothetical protein [Frigoribacterium sp. PhB107]ROP78325.1 hypothetical protein EDF18_0971 [Frigoribacterium sp. PhB107]
MAGEVRFELNQNAVRELLKGADITAELQRRAAGVVAATGGDADDYTILTAVGRNRVGVYVVTRSTAAKRAEAEDRTLTRALDGGRA